jgi:hypothetical protein
MEPGVRFANIVGRKNVIGGVTANFPPSTFNLEVHAILVWAKFQ